MQDITWLLGDIFRDFDISGLIGVIVVAIVVVNVVSKAGKKTAEAVRTSAQTVAGALHDRASARVSTAAAAARGSAPVMAPVNRPAPAVQAATPAAVPASGSIRYVSTEGVELHGPGFHGEEAPRLEKVDLGALRAKENAHTALNSAWRPPQPEEAGAGSAQAQAKPMFTAAQLREAMILKEVLDAPVSRRHGVRRTYGR